MIAIIIGAILAVVFVFVAIFSFCEEMKKTGAIAAALAAAALITGFAMYPTVNVWQRQMAGQAQLREAEWNRQIRIREAQAKKEAATLLAEAEIERARGVAESNRIVADGLGGPEGYLRYLYIQAIDKASERGGSQFVYIPTEASLPILEADRLSK